MKKSLFFASALAALCAAGPATAQYYGSQANVQANMNGNFDARIDRLQERLDAGIEAGVITRAEARPIRQEIRNLVRLETQYSAGGYTVQERQDLQQRIRGVRQGIQVADGRGGRWNRWEDDEYTGQGGPYEAEIDGWVVENNPCAGGNGIGGLFNRVLGGRSCLDVGQRVTGNLYAVPYEFRNQFRDSNNAYFRSDGNRIYQIDARTQTVLRVYSRDAD